MFARMFIKQTSTAPVKTRMTSAIDNAVLLDNSFFMTGTVARTSPKKMEVPAPITETKAPKF